MFKNQEKTRMPEISITEELMLLKGDKKEALRD